MDAMVSWIIAEEPMTTVMLLRMFWGRDSDSKNKMGIDIKQNQELYACTSFVVVNKGDQTAWNGRQLVKSSGQW